MRVRYTAQAFAEREDIFAYLDERNPSAAQAVKAFIEHSLARLATFPFSAPATDEPNVRELTLVRYPYKIYYQIEREEVWIVHIRHARRRPLSEDNE